MNAVAPVLVEERVAPEHDCPPCPACSLAVGTPIVNCAGDMTTDRWCGPDDATCWCPCCGHGWVATPAELGQALRALHAYDAREGHDRAAPCACPAYADPRQMALPGT